MLNTGQNPPGLEWCVMRPTARVLALLELLQSGGQRTVGELSHRLGVDERTVRRYAEHLTELGIPVRAQRGRYGGYQLAPTYKLPPLMLTDDEAVAVVLGLEAARRSGLLTGEATAVDSALAKVRRVLPSGLAARLESLLSTARYTAPVRPGSAPEAGVLLALAEAARASRSVSLAYTSWAGRASRRTLDPYGLVFHGGRWYVTGHDHERDAVRTFRVDRVGEVHATSDTYRVPDGFDPAGQVVSGIAAVNWTHRVSVLLHTDRAQAQRRLPATVGQLEDVAGGIRLRARVESLDGMARLLAGLGLPFTIETPERLRDEVRSLAESLREYAVGAPHQLPQTPSGADLGGSQPRDR